ncbi:hypothetical protein GLOTRDRAFT_108954, partial [Gloeophyllum trabeum ATCC 11539]
MYGFRTDVRLERRSWTSPEPLPRPSHLPNSCVCIKLLPLRRTVRESERPRTRTSMHRLAPPYSRILQLYPCNLRIRKPLQRYQEHVKRTWAGQYPASGM